MIKGVIITCILFLLVFFSYIFLKKHKEREKNLKTNELLNNLNANNKKLVVFIFGQSNAANYVSERFSTDYKIYTFFDNKLTLAKDPLRGASGNKGSIWIPFSESLMNESYFDEIIIINIAEGGSTVFDWSSQGKYHKKFINTLDQLKGKKITPNFFLWQQGEDDNLLQTSKIIYKSYFEEILDVFNAYNIQAPVVLSLTSYSPTSKTPINDTIRNAQTELAEENENVYIGPDTDLYISKKYRYDGIHFSKKGAITLAKAWEEIIIDLHKKINN